MPLPYKDRRDAGSQLALKLRSYAGRDDVIILALPRGGVPVGYEVARELGAPLDIFVVRKLGVPGHEELAMGAIASGGVLVLNHSIVTSLGIPRSMIDHVTAVEREELARREQELRGGNPMPELKGRTVILVDDGLATGSTMRAAVAAVRKQGPARLVVAVPAAAPATCEELRHEVDEIICAETPEPFYAVGAWYEDFAQTSTREIRELLERAREDAGALRL